VVSGAAQGIGAEYAWTLAREGALVAVADIDEAGAERTAKRIMASGGQAVAVGVDVSSKDSTLACARRVREEVGNTNILVNNAAIYHSMRTDRQLDVDIEYWRKIFSVNVDGALLMTQAFAPALIEAGWGRVIIQTSTAPYLGTGGHYGVSKLALIGLTRGFAKELGPHRITVNAIAPGPIFTEATEQVVSEERLDSLLGQQSIPVRAQPDVLSGTLLYLCGEGAAWVTGQTLIVDGGAATRL
jgi:NAD(P)-dependent dehydrogenase (short-subunit alcohol dehydrogenase family)